MKLPHSKENAQPGLYFYPDGKGGYKLLKVESVRLIFVRQGGDWIKQESTDYFWSEPSEFSIANSDITRVTALVDKYQSDETLITAQVIAEYLVIY